VSTATLAAAPAAIADAVTSVPDPEYPGVSIVELGLVEHVAVDETADGLAVSVDLIPTFSGCPALAMIASDVRVAVAAVPGVSSCEVRWLSTPVWSTDRISPSARRLLRDEFTVVLRRKDGGLRCPVCGSDAVEDRALAGPTRCRSVAWCGSCRNVVEVMR
jgi:ring-1,2-phenylacetyl-CoA epoxidase subunit PaaD